jgi:hypothetical protein
LAAVQLDFSAKLAKEGNVRTAASARIFFVAVNYKFAFFLRSFALLDGHG